jgi:hypothetical protein
MSILVKRRCALNVLARRPTVRQEKAIARLAAHEFHEL